MDKRRRINQKWYDTSSRNRKNGPPQGGLFPQSKIPRMTISRSHNGSLMNRDRVNYSGSRSTSRSTSRTSQVLDLSGSFRQGRSLATNDIEDILNTYPTARPRSVSLVKYDPLPAINPDQSKRSSASQDSREFDLSPLEKDLEDEFQEQRLLEQLKGLEEDEEEKEQKQEIKDTLTVEGEGQASASAFEPPKLVRSRTFDVIETNLTNLPIIEEGSTDQESSNEENSGYQRREIVITINGVPLQDYISQNRNDIFRLNHDTSEHFGLDTRPSSRSSLITHPGTPDSGFGAPAFERSAGKRSNLRSSRSLAYQLQDSDDVEATLDQGLYIRFPNDTLIFSNGALNETLGDFLYRIENMKYEGRKLKISGSSVPDVDLDKRLSHYGITEDVTINLLPES